MKNTYKIEIMDGFTKETATGWEPPKVKKILTFDRYREALQVYKEEKAKKAGAVRFYKNDKIRRFKTI